MTAPRINVPLKLLVIDAYTDAGRSSLATVDCTWAGVLYERMLKRLAPRATVDVITASSPVPALPEGANLTDYDGVVWTGSNLSAHLAIPEVLGQIELLRAHLEQGVPGFGSCWAAQLAVVATGGTVRPNPRGREFGLARKITLTDAGRAHPMFLGKPSVFDGFTSHEDEITHVGAGTNILAGNDFSRVQAVHVQHGRSTFWAVQYHPEYGPIDVARLSLVRCDQLVGQGFFRDRDDNRNYATALETLDADPDRGDIAFRLGYDGDVLNPTIREQEVRNWLASLPVGN